MSELSTVAIHSPKNDAERWVINADDFDPNKHRLWDDTAIVEESPAPSGINRRRRREPSPTPSEPDFIYNDAGEVVKVNVINPNNRTAKIEIDATDYDPDKHDLWSSHPRFRN